MSGTYPNLLFCGDPHGQFDRIYSTARVRMPDAIVLLGDIQPAKPLHEIMKPILDMDVEVCWIPGNHDTDVADEYDNLFHCENVPGLHCIHERVHTITGKDGSVIRLAGLGGIFRGKVWWPEGAEGGVRPEEGVTADAFLAAAGKGNRWRGGLPLRHRSTIFPDQWLRASTLSADVLVTHEAPHFHRNGFAILHELAKRIGASWSFHGHHHKMHAYGTHDGVQAYGVGLRGIMDLNGNVLAEDPQYANTTEAISHD